jgi:hypothetical protein
MDNRRIPSTTLLQLSICIHLIIHNALYLPHVPHSSEMYERGRCREVESTVRTAAPEGATIVELVVQIHVSHGHHVVDSNNPLVCLTSNPVVLE